MIAGVIDRCERGFEEVFGRRALVVATAPGRVNLIGEHTDYSDGFVLPMAIDRRTAVAMSGSDDGRWRFVALDAQSRVVRSFECSDALVAGERDWSAYVRGVLGVYASMGIDVGAVQVAVTSDVPMGGGLSSSAALEVATATAIEAMAGRGLDSAAKALACQRAEHEYAGVPCGIMDQFISVMGQAGRALLIDCRTHEARALPLEGVSVAIVNSMVRHELSGGEYAQRRRQCEEAVGALAARGHAVRALRDVDEGLLEELRGLVPEVVFRRARHVVSENRRTLAAAEAMERGDWAEVGELMRASHASLRDDFEVSCEELDVLVELAAGEAGVYGCRMTGGGFGGCVVALAEPSAADEAAGRVVEKYLEVTGIEGQGFVTRASDGARVERRG